MNLGQNVCFDHLWARFSKCYGIQVSISGSAWPSCFTKWTKWSFCLLFLRSEVFSPSFCNFCSVFMISIISDYKSIIKYDFAILESYFINNGEDKFHSLCEISDEMAFYFTKWSMFPLVCNFYSIFMIYIIPDYKSSTKYDFSLLELYFFKQ